MSVAFLDTSMLGVNSSGFDERLHSAADTICSAVRTTIFAVIAQRGHQLSRFIFTMRAASRHGIIPIFHPSISPLIAADDYASFFAPQVSESLLDDVVAAARSLQRFRREAVHGDVR